MRKQWVATAAVLAFALGAVGLAVVVARSDDDSLPKLPLVSASGDERGAATDVASLSAPASPLSYRFEGERPDPPDTAPAYRLAGVDAERERTALAAALGVEVQAITVDTGRWFFQAASDMAVGSTVVGCAPCPPGAACAACAPEREEMQRPPDLLSHADAERRARAMFGRLGIDGDTDVVGGPVSVDVVVRPVVEGLPTVGFEHRVSFGSRGVVIGGYGRLGRPDRLGDYPLIGVDEALERLRAGVGGGPRTLRAEVERPDAQEVVLIGVELVLQLVSDHLVPALRFGIADGEGPTVPAVVDRLLDDIAPEPRPEPMPVPEPHYGATGCGVSGQAGSADAGNEPLTVEVCGPQAAKVGEVVVFEVTATDPDAEITESECGGPQALFGDEEGVARAGCMPACAAPLKESSPGKLQRTFRHAYAKPGTYTATFRFQSVFCTKGSSSGEGRYTVVVR